MRHQKQTEAMDCHFPWSFTTDALSAAFLLVAVLFQETAAQCNGTLELTALPNVTSSLSFPTDQPSYPANAICYWQLRTGSPDYVVRLRVNNLSLERHESCSFDKLDIYDGVSTVSQRLGRLCGNVRNVTYYSSGRDLLLTFTSDSSFQGTGFNATYSAVTPPPTTTTYSTTRLMTTTATSTVCYTRGISLTATWWTRQYIQSPGYISYPNDVRCAWTLQTDRGYVIHVRVKEMNLEVTHGCAYDAVTLYDALTEASSAQLARLCGSRSGDDYYSTGRYMYITFTSDGSVGYTGFQLMYEAVLAPIKVTEPPSSSWSPSRSTVRASTVRAYTAVGILFGVVAFASLLVFVALVVVRRLQVGLKRSRPAQVGGGCGLTPYATPASHVVLGGTVQQGPPGYAAVMGGQVAYANPGYAHAEGYGPPPAYANLHGMTQVASASVHVSNPGTNNAGGAGSESHMTAMNDCSGELI